jgi:hypothetical protein
MFDFCGDSSLVEHPVLPEGGGSIPTSPLHRLRKREWTVAGVDQAIAEDFVIRHHYARGTSNTATYLHALYPANWHWYHDCEGIAWWIPPTMHAARAWEPANPEGVLCLSRLAVAPEVPTNACSFLLAHSARKIDPRRWPTLVTYADSWRGHTGAIYLAAGWRYCGQTAPGAVYTINGRMTARKAGGRTRTHAEMLALGAVCHGRFSKARFCLRRLEAVAADKARRPVT